MDHFEVETMEKLEIQSKVEFYDAAVEVDQTETSVQQSYVTVLREEDIWRRMENEIQIVSNVSCISRDEANLLLSYFSWDASKLHNEWFDNAERLRASFGLLEKSPDPSSDDNELVCGACLKLNQSENFTSISCGHRICIDCWTSNIDRIINENPDVEWNLWLKCPTIEICTASVSRDMINRFASEEEKSKYNRYLLESYVEAKKTMKWCPAFGCSCAIDLSLDSETSSVTCICLHRFCWNCSKDVHSPVDCKLAEKWLAMDNNNNQNLDWVFYNTVPCPQCQRRIDDNQDLSLKMTCLPPCNFDFCWRCQGDWTEHGEGSGCNLYTCIFDGVKYEGNHQWRKMAEVAADRYKGCLTNWQNTELSMKNTKANLQKLNTLIQDLSNTQLATVTQLKFIQEAADQIRECIRILKWSYAYEYYLIEYDVAKQAFLTCTRDTVQLLLEKLIKSVEKDLPEFQYGEEPSENFNEFCIKLTELTSIIREHNERLIRKLENGLANIVPAASNRSQSILNGEASVNVRENVDIPIVVSCPTSPQTPFLNKKFRNSF